jgi:hypothetical protein
MALKAFPVLAGRFQRSWLMPGAGGHCRDGREVAQTRS